MVMTMEVRIREFSDLRSVFLGTFPALLFCLAMDFVPGFFLGKYFDKLIDSYPIILILIPGLMGLRGNIFGSMASRLTTGLHIGTVKPSLRDEAIIKNIVIGLWLTFIPVLILWIVGLVKVGDLHSAILVLGIIFASTFFSVILLGYSTALSAIIPYLKGLDPDRIAAPIITSIADLVTLPVLILFVLIYEHHKTSFLLLFLITIFLFALIILKIKLGESEIRVVKEVLSILVITAVISSFSGIIFEQYSSLINSVIIMSVLYPSIADTAGNFGSIIGSSTSTRVHLGEIEGFIDRKFVSDLLVYSFIGVLMAVIMNGAGIVIAEKFLGADAGIILEFLVLYPALLVVSMCLAYIFAIAFTKLGFDPDNVTVPLITTVSDLLSVGFVILISIMVVGG